MNLTDVYKVKVSKKKKMRVGRGHGSGHGKTAGRGHKGQKSRSGFSMRRMFEGGQMPLIRRLPKRGFNNKWRQEFLEVNVGDLEKHFESGSEVTPDILVEKRLVKMKKSHPLPIKILGFGELTKNLKVTAHRFSKSAKEKIEKAGGSVTVLKLRKEVTRENMKRAKQEFLKRKREERNRS
ncbi:MAG: 50S ribosomal protein L15 [Planctomycetota bacterium]|nr:MAG: 50S ribosomal protein L15 [Planctomycetota bacterium]